MTINLVSSYAPTPLYHPSYIFEYIYLHTFSVNIVLKRPHLLGHKISYLTCYLELTNNKQLPILIGLRHVTTSPALPIHTGWRDATMAFWNLAEAFKHSTVYLAFTFQKLSNSNHNNSLLLLPYGLWKVKVKYI